MSKIEESDVDRDSVNFDPTPIFEDILNRLDPLIVGSDIQKRGQMRELAVANIHALDGHHIFCASYLNLVLIQYAIANMLLKGGAAVAIIMLDQILGWLSYQRVVLAARVEQDATPSP